MEKIMLELTTINTTELVNKKLGAQLNNIKKAVETGNNQQWKIADAIATIVDDELFIDDFESEKNLASVLGMSRPNLNKMKNASHYHKEVSELNAFTLSKVMELLVIPKEDIIAFLDEYMVTASSTVREIRDAVTDWKDDNIIADTEITDAEVTEDAENEVEQDSKVVCESTESSTSNSCEDTMSHIEKMIDTMNHDELLALKEYIEKRL